ncbi:polysaccharide deacetylase family protein [Rhodopseudomonas sp. P2A-2r]|uniref:polysaccharide deacetylase family protein n=1 Tax=Rhodopseudomonas sp. P2A-2r TaxID=2991972 RepID=UPI0039B6F9DF
MLHDGGMLASLKLEMAYFSGLPLLMPRRRGGAGIILKLQRVRPARRDRFQPLKSREITPEFLDAMLCKLRRWKFDIVGIDEACRRAGQPGSSRRFVCLTFDGGYGDLIAHAYPVLARHAVPFTIYLPTAFPDGVGEAWWLALEAVVAGRDRISLMMGDGEQHFSVPTISEKYQLFAFLESWMRTLAPQHLSGAIHDLCARYSVDLAALSREAAMTWDDVAKLAADPLVTIGSATVNYPVLRSLPDAAALREITMGRAVVQAALGRDPVHVAFPFGDSRSFGPRDVKMVQQAGFASAVTSVPGVVLPDGRSDLHALPRLAWDGRRRSLRALRVMLSGMAWPAER